MCAFCPHLVSFTSMKNENCLCLAICFGIFPLGKNHWSAISFLQNAFSAAITTTNNQEQARTNQHFSRPPLINGQDVNHNGTNKPSLSSISVKRSDYLRADNGPGFTFPVSASAGVLSEPPTPSMTPSSSPDRVSHQPTAVPSYTFGTDDKSKSTPRLVFSFPSTVYQQQCCRRWWWFWY